VLRVHPEWLERQNLPPSLVSMNIWGQRFEDINAFERHLSRNGVAVRKFFLHVSKAEQRRRFLSRLEQPEKNWKFEAADVLEREHWDEYMRAYEETIRHTSTAEAPWHVVPADHKWFTRLVVASVIIQTLKSLKVDFPVLDAKKQRALAKIRRAFLADQA